MKCKACNDKEAEICFSCYLIEKMEGTTVDKLRFELFNLQESINDLKKELEIIQLKLDKKLRKCGRNKWN